MKNLNSVKWIAGPTGIDPCPGRTIEALEKEVTQLRKAVTDAHPEAWARIFKRKEEEISRLDDLLGASQETSKIRGAAVKNLEGLVAALSKEMARRDSLRRGDREAFDEGWHNGYIAGEKDEIGEGDIEEEKEADWIHFCDGGGRPCSDKTVVVCEDCGADLVWNNELNVWFGTCDCDEEDEEE
jgi:hypothetical protein